jgi:prohibitin 2
MAQQAKQAAQRLGSIFPKGSGKGIGSATGALVVLGALGYGVNASLFNGNKLKKGNWEMNIY